ncbi:hypothetical protein BTGOE5_51860 [Bacillus thuringiensis]|nr:hypothetical protein BTGOE5_51860 [Bacillus thuringiensis]OFD02583.1 hypothetical protein BTGOE7_52350 [Bacillus thuringiensis]
MTISKKNIFFPILLFIVCMKIIMDVFIIKDRQEYELINNASAVVAILGLIVSIVSIIVYFKKKHNSR